MTLSAVLRLLYLWLCSEAIACQLNWDKTKTTFSPYNKYTITKRNAQSRRWRTVSEEDRGGTRGASTEASWLATLNSSSTELLEKKITWGSVRKGDAQNGTQSVLRTEVNNTDESRNEVLEQIPHGPTCMPRMIGRKRRQRRVAESDRARHSQPLPVAMAQEVEAEPPSRLNTSDYVDEYSLPDFADTTPFVPVNTRTRRKQVKNPFYPVTAKSYGAYVVMITAALIFSMGIIGNVSVMCIVCHNYYMRSISNSLLASLALWDFVIIFFCLPLVVFHELTKKWLLGEFSCRIIPYLELKNLHISTSSVIAELLISCLTSSVHSPPGSLPVHHSPACLLTLQHSPSSGLPQHPTPPSPSNNLLETKQARDIRITLFTSHRKYSRMDFNILLPLLLVAP